MSERFFHSVAVEYKKVQNEKLLGFVILVAWNLSHAEK